MSTATVDRGRTTPRESPADGLDDLAPRRGVELGATVALALYSLVAASGLVRVFGDWSFLGDAVAVVAVGHGLSYVTRLTRLPVVLAQLVVTIALAVLVAWLVYPHTFSAFLPTGETLDVVRGDLTLVREQFATTTAPVVYATGWAFLAIAATASTVLLGDVFAFRIQGRGEALVPGAVLFVFVAALGTDRGRIPLTLALVGAGFLTVAVLRARAARRPRTWLGPERHPLRATLPAAFVAAAIVTAGAWALGPRLPGADAEPWVDTSSNDREGGGVTEIVSPLVDIRSRLVDQAATEMFVVAATQPSNWRLSALPSFDGSTWGLPQRSLEDVEGTLGDPRTGAVDNEQTVTVAALGGRLVPAAADPVHADGDGLRFNDDTSTLVRVDRELLAGDVADVDSAMPVFSVDELRGAGSESPPEDLFLALPDDFPEAVTTLARDVVAGQPTSYDQARALQDWFRANFTYSVDVPRGHSTSAIEAFLERRSGYCEQFAGTYAAMARAVGLPSRVAVGFTPGDARADGSYSVLGRNAHAWPEVWFDDLGWVPFEPTPGRGAPSGEQYTGVPPQQDSAQGQAPPPTTTTTVPPGAAAPPAAATTTIAGQAPVIPPEPPTTREDAGGLPWLAILAASAILGLLLAAPALIRRLRRRRHSHDLADQIGELWSRARHVVGLTGVRFDPAMTPSEQAATAARRLPLASASLASLADAATVATYAPPEEVHDRFGTGAGGTAGDPREWCDDVEAVVVDSLTTGGRLRRYFTDLR